MKLILGTRKGLIIYNKSGNSWVYETDHFQAIPVSMFFVDQVTGAWWAGLSHGHWGEKLHRSMDQGKSWEEVAAPEYPEGSEIKEGKPAKLNLMWAMQRAGEKLFIGTEPGGLFESRDDGKSWTLCTDLWNDPNRQSKWFGGGYDNPAIHSIEVDPRDPNHLYIGISCAGVYESHDAGSTWKVKNKGMKSDFLPNPTAEVGHDPHLLKLVQGNPDILWQQNHGGVWVSKDGSENWIDVRSQDSSIADFGFTIAVDHENADRAWVVPGISDEVRVAVDLALCVSRTEDGGQTWKACRAGLPQQACYDIVYRHALDRLETNLVFGTTTGNVFYSEDDGDQWNLLSASLPMVNVVKLLA